MLFSFGLLAFSILKVLPLIPREIISPPSSDRIVMFFRSPLINDPEIIVQEIIPRIVIRVDVRVDKARSDEFSSGIYGFVHGT